MPRVVPGAEGDARISGPRGPLSRQQSEAILEKLRRSSRASDILDRHVALEEALVGTPLVSGNRVQLLEDGPATYASMFEAIRAAKDHVNLETYIFEDDDVGREFAELLLAKQAAGVQVNLIYDSVGSIRTPKAFFQRLRDAGVQVLEFNPVNPLTARSGWRVNHRDHRKLLITDGRVAFVGGINISDVYSSSPGASRPAAPSADSGPWRDTHARIEGPVVADFQKLFLQTWRKQDGPELPSRQYLPRLEARGDELVRAIGSAADESHSLIYVTLVSAILHAEKSVRITSAYFIPDPQLLGALGDAARRGVEVSIVLPSFSDSWAVFHAGRSHYSSLLASGVKLHERRKALLHAKYAVIDGVWSTIGSTNLDPRSFVHNDEINAVILGAGFARQMEDMFRRDLDQSMAVTPDAWRRRPLSWRMKEWLARWWQYWL